MITKNIIGKHTSARGDQTTVAIDPRTSNPLEGSFSVATSEEVEQAVRLAKSAWKTFSQIGGQRRAAFLEAIADEIEALDDQLIDRVTAESGLPEGRVKGERGRTCNQLRLFAEMLRDGSWAQATIDTGDPKRSPIPKPDIRKVLSAVGPIVVFTASNFPLAFSTAGGDTASALAAGCPVIIKAHESHLGTNAWVSQAIQRAAIKTEMPDGVFSSLVGIGYSLGEQLVRHKDIKGVAFTGSHRGGYALYKIASERDEPIPVFAEMGSTNPIFITPEFMQKNSKEIAHGVAGSVNLGAGQFCTNPGLLVTVENSYTNSFINDLVEAFGQLEPGTMLNSNIRDNYLSSRKRAKFTDGVNTEFESLPNDNFSAPPAVYSTTSNAFLNNPHLHLEIFGPSTILIKCPDLDEMIDVAQELKGQLTASLFMEENSTSQYSELVDVLKEKVGRLIFNGYPTGVEVGYAMQHGGPFPATTDSRYTSVGTDAIYRFVRPIAYQNSPQDFLPEELKDDNPLGILRKINGKMTRDKIE